MKIKWWDRQWKLVLFLILLPVVLVPIIGVLLFPETPLIEFFLYGLIFSIFVATTFRIIRTVEILGLRIIILVLGGMTLLALLLFVLKILLT